MYFHHLLACFLHGVTPRFGQNRHILFSRHFQYRIFIATGKKMPHFLLESVHRRAHHRLLPLEIVIVLIFLICIVLQREEHAVIVIAGDVLELLEAADQGVHCYWAFLH